MNKFGFIKENNQSFSIPFTPTAFNLTADLLLISLPIPEVSIFLLYLSLLKLIISGISGSTVKIIKTD